MKNSMKMLFMALFGALFFVISPVVAGGSCPLSDGSGACPPNPEPTIPFKKGNTVTTIPVTVCHQYWDLLNGDPVKGTRWWRMQLRRKSWQQDSPAKAYAKCRQFWVVRGTSLWTKSSCCAGWITTGKITKKGTYTLKSDVCDQKIAKKHKEHGEHN